MLRADFVLPPCPGGERGKSGAGAAGSVAVLSDLLLQAGDLLAARRIVQEFTFAVGVHARDALPGLERDQLAPCLGTEALTLDLFGFVRRGLGCGIRFGRTAFAKRGLWIDVLHRCLSLFTVAGFVLCGCGCRPGRAAQHFHFARRWRQVSVVDSSILVGPAIDLGGRRKREHEGEQEGSGTNHQGLRKATLTSGLSGLYNTDLVERI